MGIGKRCLLLVLVCSTLSPAPAQEVTERNTASVIRALEHEWVEGQSSNDNRALDLIFDNALVYIEYGKLVTKGEYLSRVRLAKPEQLQIEMGAMTVRTLGTTAIVVGTYREVRSEEGKSSRKQWRFVDTWVFENGRWMLVAAASSPLLK